MPITDLLKLLPNRSYNSLINHAQSLGMVSKGYLDLIYTVEEEEFIRKNYGILTDKEIAKHLGRSLSGIQDKRRKLGLYYSAKDFSNYENIAKLLRGHLSSWKNDSIKRCNFRCILTGSHDFVVHHIYSFNKIFNEAMKCLEMEGYLLSNDIDDYTSDELDHIIAIFLNIHNKYPLGVCIRKDIHNLFHRIYGAGGNTEQQWNQFILNYKDGKYNDMLN